MKMDDIISKALSGFLLPICISAVVAFLVQPLAKRYWERPDIIVEGVLPINLHEEETRGGVNSRSDSLGLIFRLRNDSPSQGIVSLALIDGCAKISPFAADGSLPQELRSHEGQSIVEIVESRKNAVQRISVAGQFRRGSALEVVPPYATSYVGVLFPLEIQRGVLGVPGSVSLEGDCSKVKVANDTPGVFHVFTEGVPRSLRPEFSTGQLRISLIVGSRNLDVPREDIKSIRSLPWNSWPVVSLGQLYENPGSLYPEDKVNP